MTTTRSLSIDLLRTDADTQCRVSINKETVEDYTELIEASGRWPLGPIDVFHDGADYIVADGFHRTLAAQRAKRGSIPCQIHKGTARDARIFGMTANDGHGLRMSRADKRACVEWLLDNEKMTQVAIAEAAGVSLRTVKYIVHHRKQKGQIAPRATAPSNTQNGETGKDDRTDSEVRMTKEPSSRSPRNGTDQPGTPSLPPKVAPAAEVGKRLGGIIQGISALVNEAIELAGKPGGEFIQASQLRLDCGQLNAVLKAGRFKRVCRTCDGKGRCKYCNSRGWVTYEQWDGQKGNK